MHRLPRFLLSLSCLAFAAIPVLVVTEAGAKGRPKANGVRLPPRPGCSSDSDWSKKKELVRDIDRDGVPNIVDPDIDGDRKPNGADRNVDGDKLANRRDTEIDADAMIPNKFDRDIDSDRRGNARDRDMDGDGVANTKDRDMNADCKVDGPGTDAGGDGGDGGDGGGDTPTAGDCDTQDGDGALPGGTTTRPPIALSMGQSRATTSQACADRPGARGLLLRVPQQPMKVIVHRSEQLILIRRG